MSTHTSKKVLGSIFSVVLLDLLGFGIVVPVIAPLFLSSTGSFAANLPMGHREIMLGLLIAIYPFMQFFSAPFLGALADKYGRRKLLILCLAGTIIDYILCGIGIVTGSVWLLFVSRAIAGFLGGNIAIARAVIADVSTPETKSKNFGIIGIAVGIGFIFGPFIGSIFSDNRLASWFTYATPFWLSAVMAAISLFVLWRYLPETLTERMNKPITLLTGPRNIMHAFKLSSLRTLFVTAFLQLFGFAIYTQFFQVFLIERFHPTQLMIGVAIGYIGILIVLTQGFLNPPCARIVSPTKLVTWSLITLALSIAGVSFSFTLPHMIIFLGISAIASGFLYPNLTALVSNSAAQNAQGETMGIYQSVESLAQSAGPFLAGFVAVYGEGKPLYIAAAATLAAFLVFITLFKSSTK